MAAILALVIISLATLALVAEWGPGHGPTAGCARLFFRCLRWGVGIGTATGAVIGALVLLVSGLGDGPVVGPLALSALGAFYGAIVGALVSVIPTVLGALIITKLIQRRHPHPAKEKAVESDLHSIFRAVVMLLNGALILASVASGGGPATLAVCIPFVVAGNACVVLMLCRARRSIGQAWAGAPI